MKSVVDKPSIISPIALGVGPRWLEKYNRSRAGLNTGPVISELSWPTTRANGATWPSGVMITISMLPPSSATNRSPEPASTVMLSTPVSTAVPSSTVSGAGDQISSCRCNRTLMAWTRWSSLVVK